jgi:hypothetical protein
MQKHEIIKKWYTALRFPSQYDAEFFARLQEADLSDITVFEEYAPQQNTPQQNLFACLYFCEDLEKSYAKAGIPHAVLEDSLHDLVLWNDTFHSVHGCVGLTEFPWLNRLFEMTIFRLGRLQFSIAPSEFSIDEIGIHEGDTAIEVHIPAGEALRYEACQQSFLQARTFFKTHFPTIPQEYYTCHSWLLDETITPLLGEHSNVTKFQTFFTPVSRNKSDAVLRYTFLWNTKRENLATAVAKTGFAERLKKAVLEENATFYEVLGWARSPRR